MTPLEKFESEKNAFIQRYAPDFIEADWEALQQSFKDYAKAINTVQTDEQEEFISLAQLPEQEYEENCIREQECLLQRMVAVLANPNATPTLGMLTLYDRRPENPINDYYQILLLWKAGQYDKVELLCGKLLSHIDESLWRKQKHCPLIAYYVGFSDEFVEQHLHKMITDFSLSEIYYYLAKAKEKLNKNFKVRLSGCYYLRARDCLVSDVLRNAWCCINRAITLVDFIAFENFKNFIDVLLGNQQTPQAVDSQMEQAKKFLNNNSNICSQYRNFLLKNGKPLPQLIKDWSQGVDENDSHKRRKLSAT